MKAIVITEPGGPEVLQLQDVPDAVVEAGHILLKVVAAGINRADTSQRQGRYPPPPGAPLYPGLEVSGIVEAVATDVTRWKVGDMVCALLGGGGYAEKVAVAEGHCLPIPKGVSLQDAAALPEVTCTVWSTIFMQSKLSAGETLLIHGGSSGIGTFAIQIAKAKGATVFVTVGSEEKGEQCKQLGAHVSINYRKEDFVARVKEETNGKGVNVILDIMGASYLNRNLDALAVKGRLFMIGFQGGATGEINISPIVAKRLTVQGAGLRTRSIEDKAEIVSKVLENVWPEIEAGTVRPVIDCSLPLSDASKGHTLIESSTHVGKILLLP